MSRSGYSDDYGGWELVMYRGAVDSATRGKRGQVFLRDLLAALDAMPEKRLIAGEIEENGNVCALGALARVRGVDVSKLDPDDAGSVAPKFDIAVSLAREVVYINDEYGSMSYVPPPWRRDENVQGPGGGYVHETDAGRWTRVREWVASQIKGEPA